MPKCLLSSVDVCSLGHPCTNAVVSASNIHDCVIVIDAVGARSSIGVNECTARLRLPSKAIASSGTPGWWVLPVDVYHFPLQHGVELTVFYVGTRTLRVTWPPVGRVFGPICTRNSLPRPIVV